ncbi:hypothetical protein P4W15_00675 [Morganella morganii]|nr:hypothetical protein [Morganella morganii]
MSAGIAERRDPRLLPGRWGEFGATLMLAGATRFKTETLPMAIYLNIASGDFSLALGCALILMALAIVLLVALHRLKRQPSHAAR